MEQFLVPLIEQWPIDGAGAEIRQVQIARKPIDRALEQRLIIAEDRPMARQQPFRIGIANTFQRPNKIWVPI